MIGVKKKIKENNLINETKKFHDCIIQILFLTNVLLYFTDDKQSL